MAKKVKKAPEAVVENAPKSLDAAAGKQQSAANQEAPVEGANRAAGNEMAKQPGIETTLGKTLMLRGKVVNTEKGVLVSGAYYGTYNAAGKDQKAKTEKMVLLAPRVLTAAQVAEYTKLSGNKDAQNAYLLKTLYPMHADDKSFGKVEGQLNGRAVDYVIIQKITKENALAPGQTELTAEQKKYIGSYELKAGVKGQEEGRVHVILSPQEREMYKQRAEVTLKYEPVMDEHGNQKKNKDGKALYNTVVESVGAPLTLLAIASKIEQRAVNKKAKVDAIKAQFPSGKYHYPESAKVTSVRWFPSKEDPKRLVMTGVVNDISLKPVTLSEEASFAIRNKIITNEEALMENKELRSQLFDLNKGNYLASVEKNAVDAMVARVTDPTAKSFTAEQVDAINIAIKRSGDRGAAIKALWEKAEPQMLAKGADKAWFESAQQELNAVAAKTWEQKPEGVGMSR